MIRTPPILEHPADSRERCGQAEMIAVLADIILSGCPVANFRVTLSLNGIWQNFAAF
jgi:hypothetical protein